MAALRHFGQQKKGLLSLIVIVIALSIALSFIFFWAFGASSSNVKDSDPGNPAIPPTATKRPSATPTETPIPTSTPPPAERVAKCKDDGNASTVNLVADWQVGDARTLTVTRYRQRFAQRKAKVVVQSFVKYRVHILDATADGYKIEWLAEDAQVQKGTDARNLTVDDILLQDLLTLRSSLRIVYSTDVNGAYRQIENWDQVLAFHNQLHDLFNLRIEQIVRSAKAREKVLAAIDPIWTDHAQIEQLYSQEIRAYHGAYGLPISALQSIRRADIVPNLMGYMPLDSESVVRLSTYNESSSCAFLDLRRTLTPASIQQFLHDFLTRQTQISSRSSATSGEMSATQIEDAIRYQVDMQSSWLQMAQMQRVTMVESLNMVDGIIVADMTEATP